MKLRVKGFGLLLLLVVLALCSTIDICDARRGKHWRPRSSPSSSLLKRKSKPKKGSSHRQHGGNRPSLKQPVSPPPGPGVGKGYQTPYQPSPSPSPNAPVSPSPGNSHGHSSPKPPSPSCGKGNQPPAQPPAAVPHGAVWCMLILQLEGTILAPTNAKAWGSGLLQWLEFTKLNGIVIQGNGIINGRGQQWWTYADPDDDNNVDTQYNEELERMPQVKP